MRYAFALASITVGVASILHTSAALGWVAIVLAVIGFAL